MSRERWAAMRLRIPQIGLWAVVAMAWLLFVPAAEAQQVAFEAADGVTVYADLFPAAADAGAPVILLFHQAGGDARGEYGPIIPRLRAEGYTVLAVDQRSGGSRFGRRNRTVDGRPEGSTGYCEAYPDLEAALAFIRGRGYGEEVAAWGSSYSAALVIRLGAEHPDDLAAILAFSPASSPRLAGCRPERYLEELRVPLLALRPDSEMRSAEVRRQAELLEGAGARVYVADGGVHGSSMLVPERAEGDVEPTWTVVLDFLRTTLSPGS